VAGERTLGTMLGGHMLGGGGHLGGGGQQGVSEADIDAVLTSDDFRMYGYKVRAEQSRPLTSAAGRAGRRGRPRRAAEARTSCVRSKNKSSPAGCCRRARRAAPAKRTGHKLRKNRAPPTPQILPCSRRYAHDWTSCPFFHPGEKAQRRCPRAYPYVAIPCPDLKKARAVIAARGMAATREAAAPMPWRPAAARRQRLPSVRTAEASRPPPRLTPPPPPLPTSPLPSPRRADGRLHPRRHLQLLPQRV
jgi:hypothetical protein